MAGNVRPFHLIWFYVPRHWWCPFSFDAASTHSIQLSTHIHSMCVCFFPLRYEVFHLHKFGLMPIKMDLLAHGIPQWIKKLVAIPPGWWFDNFVETGFTCDNGLINTNGLANKWQQCEKHQLATASVSIINKPDNDINYFQAIYFLYVLFSNRLRPALWPHLRVFEVALILFIGFAIFR